MEYDGAQRAALHGLQDLFETADRLGRQRTPSPPRLQALIVAEADWLGPARRALSALILPPSLLGIPSPGGTAALAPWIRWQHRAGCRVCSVCAGAFVLAETGLLDGRSVTTHWALAADFAARFPAIPIDCDKLLIDDDDIITAGGVMAWIDLGLRLVERLCGPAVMLDTARMFLVDPAGREQRYYANPAPRTDHGDAPIRSVQQWLESHFAEAVAVPALARRAALNERTFLRRFRAATGHTPTAYLQQLRIAKARELLELTRTPIDDVAWQVGYLDPSAFRKLFHRQVGLAPGAYRQRFAAALSCATG